jgi:hypothetical protein
MLCLRKIVGLEIVLWFFWKIDVWDSVQPLTRPSRVVGFADDKVLPRYLHFGGVCLIPFLFVCLEPRREQTTDSEREHVNICGQRAKLSL